jgi:hypothetical protein
LPLDEEKEAVMSRSSQYFYDLWEKAGFPEDEHGNAIIPQKTIQPQSKKGEENGNSQIRTSRPGPAQGTVRAESDQQITQTIQSGFSEGEMC